MPPFQGGILVHSCALPRTHTKSFDTAHVIMVDAGLGHWPWRTSSDFQLRAGIKNYNPPTNSSSFHQSSYW
ncbi:hypothetical protein LMH87_006549 [Akanthomyces muscarius]|uniref:Uncharacterized protein n=1 Tax=Akanthomyces muscarius TaxID=2231603 RepID=A0A9W8QP29_AKAMU|nr:hypothetical protein LMH87_006549 [Akanthomyces muscarius]KAJ4164895.1 hypothetical protein LMH87_006549 [Akanthomyces muscarius]